MVLGRKMPLGGWAWDSPGTTAEEAEWTDEQAALDAQDREDIAGWTAAACARAAGWGGTEDDAAVLDDEDAADAILAAHVGLWAQPVATWDELLAAAQSELRLLEWPGQAPIAHVLNGAGIVRSRAEGRRLVAQGGVRVDGIVVNVDYELEPGMRIVQVARSIAIRVQVY